MRRSIGWLAAGCLAWGGGVAAATATLPPDAVLLGPGEAALNDKAMTLASTVLEDLAQDDAEQARSRLRAVDDPVEFEAAAAQVIQVLQAQAPSTAGEALLRWLEHAPTRVYRRHEETAADWFQPVFDLPGRAASARRLHVFAAARDQWVAALEASPDAVARVPDPGLLGAAIERLSEAASERLARAASRGGMELPGPAWAALARRHPRADVLASSLREAPPLDLLPVFDAVTTQAEPKVALEWLTEAARRPELASAAVLGLGRLAARMPDAEAALAAHLGDPETGASAAAAFAQLDLPDRLARIDSWLGRAQTSGQVNDLALALRLEGSPAARRRLQALADDPRLGLAQRKELQR